MDDWKYCVLIGSIAIVGFVCTTIVDVPVQGDDHVL